MSNLPANFVFSQSSLQDYVDCPRRFELRYLKRLRWPAVQAEPVLEHERLMAQGADFHHLCHQYLAGIPAETLAQHIPDVILRNWWETFLQTTARHLHGELFPETTLTVPLGDYYLTARYDLIALGERALIFDWKTSRLRPRDALLAERMQTLVYRYVLANCGSQLTGGDAIPPEQIGMNYWFANDGGTMRTFPYSAAQLAADEAKLLALVEEIDTRQDFPLTPDLHPCAYCVYRSYCERGDSAGALDDWDEDFDAASLDDLTLDLDQIAEIEF